MFFLAGKLDDKQKYTEHNCYEEKLKQGKAVFITR